MSDRQRCNSCGGEYAPTLSDGTLYFHACPPLSLWEVEALLASGDLKLTDAQRAAVVAGELAVPRPLARDENVPSTRPRDTGSLKSEGTGVTAVVDVDPIVEVKL